MSGLFSFWSRLTGALKSSVIEHIVLLMTRIGLGMIFYNSYKTKIVEGTWFTPNDSQQFLFQDLYSGLPIPTDIAIPMTIYAEFFFPMLLFFGLFTRFGALALMGMALVIQIFIFPTLDHFLGWDMMVLALGAVIVTRGPGIFSLDALLGRLTGISGSQNPELKAA